MHAIVFTSTSARAAVVEYQNGEVSWELWEEMEENAHDWYYEEEKREEDRWWHLYETGRLEEEIKREEEWRRSTLEWFDNPENFDDINYSDIYKDYYGYRPR